MNAQTTERLHRSILHHSLLGIILTAVVVSCTALYTFYQHLTSAQQQTLINTARVTALGVEQWLTKASDTAVQIASRSRVRENLAAYNRGEISQQELQKRQDKLADALLLSRTHTVAHITQLDRQGRVALQAGEAIGFDPKYIPLPDNDTPQLHGPLTVDHKRYLVVAAPIQDRQGQRVGTDLVLYSFAGLNQLLVQNQLRTEPNAQLLLMHSSADESIQPVIETATTQKLLNETTLGILKSVAKEPHSPGENQAPQEHIRRLHDPRGDAWIAAYAPIAHADWELFLLQPASVVRTPVLQELLKLVIVIAGLLAGAIYIMSRLLQPLSGEAVLHDQEQAQRIKTQTQELKRRNRTLANSLAMLKRTQEHLVKQETLASLGSTVAGFAHEINTPLGVAISSISLQRRDLQEFKEKLATGKIKRSELDTLVQECEENSAIAAHNLERAAQLVRSFKQVSADQSHETLRRFNLKHYIEEIVLNMRPTLKHTAHTIKVSGDASVELTSYPGPLAQIITNLVENALNHAFEAEEKGHIELQVSATKNGAQILYEDDGKGIAPSIRTKVFNPFFTTKRSKGGTGLGLSIVHNLVYSKLGGSLVLETPDTGGTRFRIRLSNLEHEMQDTAT